MSGRLRSKGLLGAGLLLFGLSGAVPGCSTEEKGDEALYSDPPFPQVEMDALILFTTFPVDMAAASVAWLITPGCAEETEEGVFVLDGVCAGYLGTAEVTAPGGVFLPPVGAEMEVDWKGWGIETPLALLTMDGSSRAVRGESDAFYGALTTNAAGTLASVDSGVFPVVWEGYEASDLGAWVEGTGEISLAGRIVADGIGDFTISGTVERSLACPIEPSGRIVLSGDPRGQIVLRPNGRRSCDGCLEWQLGDESGTYCVQTNDGGGGSGGGPQEEGEGSCYVECGDGPACGSPSLDQADCEDMAEFFCGGGDAVQRAEHVDCAECDGDCDPDWYP